MIVESTYTEGPIQVDGRRYVKEKHIDDHGNKYEYEWLGSQNANSVVSARAAALTQMLAHQRDPDEIIVGND